MPELKTWSTKEFTLPTAPGFDQSFNSLAHYKQTGLMLDILYNTLGNGPFFGLDAWKIDEISAVLEFKDKNGNNTALILQRKGRTEREGEGKISYFNDISSEKPVKLPAGIE